MSKPFVLKLTETRNDWDITIAECVREITDDPTVGRVRFSAQNLDECPEDAILSRSLFSGHDYIAALKMGMRIARSGYDSISYEIEEGEW